MLALLLALALAGPWPADPDGPWHELDTGVSYVDVAEGGEPLAVQGARVVVHYTGMLADGTVFDSSRDRGAPFAFQVGAHQVIRGWEDGLVGAGPGTVRRLVIPPDQGYGDRASGPIPPGSTLYFEVEVLEVHPPRVPPAAPRPVPDDAFRRYKGLRLADLEPGTGRKPKPGERVCVDWTAWDGARLVEHTLDRERCRWFRYEPGKVAQGLFLGIATLREGGLRQVRVPAELAAPPLRPPEATPGAELLYEVRLVEAKR